MGIISCPSCQGKLRVPDDGVARKVKCPSCQQIFQTAGKSSTPPKSGGAAAATPRKSTSKPAFEVVDEDDDETLDDVFAESSSKKSRRRDDDDDDDDDRPRRRSRRDDDDEEDDRPRSRRDRDRDRRGGGGRSRANWAMAYRGLQLAFFAQFLMAGAIGILIIGTLLIWAGVMPPRFMTYFMGLAGLGCWILSTVGACFFFAIGPTKGPAFGLGIASACVSIIHLVLLFTQLTDSGRMARGVLPGVGGGSLNWGAMLSQMYWVPLMVGSLIENGGRGLFQGTFWLTALLEIVGIIVLMLFIRSAASELRDSSAGGMAMTVAIGIPSALVVMGLLMLILNEIDMGPVDPNIGIIFILFVMSIFLGLIIFLAFGIKMGLDAIERRV